MNDFTKDELCALRDSRCYHMDDSYPSNDPLFKKLELMIDNYCEHERCSPTDALNVPLHCLDCGRRLE